MPPTGVNMSTHNMSNMSTRTRISMECSWQLCALEPLRGGDLKPISIRSTHFRGPCNQDTVQAAVSQAAGVRFTQLIRSDIQQAAGVRSANLISGSTAWDLFTICRCIFPCAPPQNVVLLYSLVYSRCYKHHK
jgi:hypothetical protein